MVVRLVSNTGTGPGAIRQYLVSYRARRYFVSVERSGSHPVKGPTYSLEIQRFPPPSHGSVELLHPQPGFTSPRSALQRARTMIRSGRFS